MSEYQYYEFVALDRALTSKQIAELREVSTRAEISSNRFVNEYHWGDFRGDPHLLLRDYFDVMLYVANWGTHRLMFGMPAGSISAPWLRLGDSDGMQIRKFKDRIIIDLCSEMEPEDDVDDGDGWLASLAPLRAELLAGDERPLYLAQLASASGRDVKNTSSIPIPPGLKKLSPAQEAMVEFLRVDPALLDAAAVESPALKALSAADLSTWIATLSQPEKDGMLTELLRDDAPGARAKVLRQFRQFPPATHEPRKRKSRS